MNDSSGRRGLMDPAFCGEWCRFHGDPPHAVHESGRVSSPEHDAKDRLARVLDVLNRYDESCQDDTCECCSTWRSHVSAALTEADL